MKELSPTGNKDVPISVSAKRNGAKVDCVKSVTQTCKWVSSVKVPVTVYRTVRYIGLALDCVTMVFGRIWMFRYHALYIFGLFSRYYRTIDFVHYQLILSRCASSVFTRIGKLIYVLTGSIRLVHKSYLLKTGYFDLWDIDEPHFLYSMSLHSYSSLMVVSWTLF